VTLGLEGAPEVAGLPSESTGTIDVVMLLLLLLL
jgi:hypothetical protein